MKKVAIVTLEGFNEIDSLLAYSMLNRLKDNGLVAEIVSPSSKVTSMNGLVIEAHQNLSRLNEYDAVLIGSGNKTKAFSEDVSFLSSFALSRNQLTAAQCSGALILLKKRPDIRLVSTDNTTKQILVDAGITVSDASFTCCGQVATAGGCLAAEYLATWIASELVGKDAAANMLESVVPVDEREMRIQEVTNKVSANSLSQNAGIYLSSETQ